MKTYTISQMNYLIERFEREELPKSEWTHEAHLVVAIWYVTNLGLEKAIPMVRERITKHNTSVGTVNDDNGGYHETITIFWLMVADQFLENCDLLKIDHNTNDFIISDFGKKDFQLGYYSERLLFSVNARHKWTEPDLQSIRLLTQ